MSSALDKLTYLAIDCQTTGNNSQKDHLLEIGWCVFNLRENVKTDACQTLLIRPAEGIELPKRIQKLTGIKASDLNQAVAVSEAIDSLVQSARDVEQKNGMAGCPTVIHYARFEMGFLQNAIKRSELPYSLPLEVICTHQIATRLLPQLPRKGLRAVAGYLGHSVPAEKRCSAHLQATQWIWRHMVTRLADEAGVETLDQLCSWLTTHPKPKTPKSYPMPESIRKTLPNAPGIYRMKRANEDVLYIGKATILKQRVLSYFQKSRRHPEHILEMLTQAKDMEITPTATALEASLLETDAIKQDNPPYNVALVRSHRGIFYLSRNFKNHAPEHHKGCPLGPVPSVESFAAAYALGRQLHAPVNTVSVETIMAMPLAYCPDRETFEAGFSIFREKHGQLFKQKSVKHAVMHIGHVAWQQKMEAKNGVDEDRLPDDPENDETEEFSWTPEAVSNALESICRRCGILLRRARWFHMLQHAQVAWELRAGETRGRRVLTLSNGAVVDRLHLKRGEAPLKPPASGMPRKRFVAAMDLDTYDRLRVLTTEIRRLVSEERLVCIRLGRGVLLYPDQMRRLLYWI